MHINIIFYFYTDFVFLITLLTCCLLLDKHCLSYLSISIFNLLHADYKISINTSTFNSSNKIKTNLNHKIHCNFFVKEKKVFRDTAF